jgi:hypothetical protein
LVVIDAEPVGCVQLRNPPLAYGYMNDKAWSLLVSLLFIVLLCNQGTSQVLSVTRHRLPVHSLHIFCFRKLANPEIKPGENFSQTQIRNEISPFTSELLPPDTDVTMHAVISSVYQITQVNKKMRVFWDIAPCSLAGVDWCFRCAYCIHHQGNPSVRFEGYPLLHVLVWTVLWAACNDITSGLICESSEIGLHEKDYNISPAWKTKPIC